MSQLFISYSRKDKPWVKTLVAALKAAGHTVLVGSSSSTRPEVPGSHPDAT